MIVRPRYKNCNEGGPSILLLAESYDSVIPFYDFFLEELYATSLEVEEGSYDADLTLLNALLIDQN